MTDFTIRQYVCINYCSQKEKKHNHNNKQKEKMSVHPHFHYRKVEQTSSQVSVFFKLFYKIDDEVQL